MLADGRILECDEHHDADLFWALRGAGAGNFGVVTSFQFRTVPAPDATNIHAAWPYSQAAAVIGAWQGWAPFGPDELAASLKVTASADMDEPPAVDVYAALLGTETDAAELLDQLVVRGGRGARRGIARAHVLPRHPAILGRPRPCRGRGDRSHGARRRHRHPTCSPSRSSSGGRCPTKRSQCSWTPSPRHGHRENRASWTSMPWGGAYNRVPQDATAFVHRAELFQIKHAAVVDPPASTNAEAAHRWVTHSWTSVHPWGSGRVFQNFADPDLEGWPAAYYGTNTPLGAHQGTL